uniref:RNA helicase n=1 Tax=Kalanchoe fedtschenkoi TaxID=63787 RepID=A0A7N0ZTE6_KALFE
MPASASTRLLVRIGESLPRSMLLGVSGSVQLYSSVRFLSRHEKSNGPLTLASVGFRNNVDTPENSIKIKAKQLESFTEIPDRLAVVPRKDYEVLHSEGKGVEVKKAPRKAEVLERISEIPSSRVKETKAKKTPARRKPLDIEAAPFAATSFSELGLPELLIKRLETEGFMIPTDVQSAAIPTILKNHDVVIQSYTGSGKTLAYLLPILAEVGPLRRTDFPVGVGQGGKADIDAVVVAPSRELAMQIVRAVEKLLGPDNKKMVQQLVGGANRSRQEEGLRKNKPAIVVGTPGRIAEISAAGKLHTHDCRFLVLDEVDELLSFNFRESMHRILEHVGRRPGAHVGSKGLASSNSERQTIMVSASVPFSVIRAARSWGHDPLLVQAKSITPIESIPAPGFINMAGPTSDKSSESSSQSEASVVSLPPSVKHYYSLSKQQHKMDTLRRCVYALDAQCVIAFMNHSKQLKDAVFKLEARGMTAAELHGDLGKLGRSTTLKKFKNGEVRVLVTNELSARGLDVPNCDLVVNLDLPTDSVHYAHRAGRTGRLGRKGTVVTICEESQMFVVKKLEKQLGVSIDSCVFKDGKLTSPEAEE